VLLVIYQSFIKVKEKLDILLKNPKYKQYIDEYMKQQLDKLNEIEKNKPINALFFDEVDFLIFNINHK